MDWGDLNQAQHNYDEAEKRYHEGLELAASPTLKDANEVRSFRSGSDSQSG